MTPIFQAHLPRPLILAAAADWNDEEAGRDAESHAEGRLLGRRVLVVEDEAIVAWEIADAIRDAGGVVAGVAGRVPDALATIERLGDKIEAAVLDANLHGRAVTPVAEKLEAIGAPFLFYTANAGSGDFARLFPGRPVLSKPMRMERLIDAVAALDPT